MFLYAFTPFETWAALIVFSLIPTIVLYLVLNKVVQENFAKLQGTFRGFAVELGGPVALYGFLILLGQIYIPPYAEITLKGHVKDVDEQILKDYYIAPVNLKRFQDETFEVRVPRNSQDTYGFLIVKNTVPHFIQTGINNTDNVELEEFPDGKLIKIKGEDLKDQNNNPLPEEYKVVIEPIVRPNPASLREGKIEVIIENHRYKAIFLDSKNNIRAEEFLPDVLPGSRYPLPNPINIRLED